jgi:hypothetical protein
MRTNAMHVGLWRVVVRFMRYKLCRGALMRYNLTKVL